MTSPSTNARNTPLQRGVRIIFSQVSTGAPNALDGIFARPVVRGSSAPVESLCGALHDAPSHLSNSLPLPRFASVSCARRHDRDHGDEAFRGVRKPFRDLRKSFRELGNVVHC